MIHPYLYRKDIECIASEISEQYKAIFVPQKRLCYHVDPFVLADGLGFSIAYRKLSTNGTDPGL